MRRPEYTLGGVVFGTKAVLIGSLFYKSDRKVLDHRKGEVDRDALRRELGAVERLKARTGLDHAIDVIAETPQAMKSYLDLLAETTEQPLLIGGMNEETRMAGYEKVKEIGLAGRCGVNSISPETTAAELGRIKECGLRFAILQTMDPSAVYPEDKIRILRDDLMGKCDQAAVEGMAVDVGVMDFTSVYLAVETIRRAKEIGVLAGCAPSNAAYQPLASNKLTRRSTRAINVALNTMVQTGGADFLIYGPLRAASYVFEAAAVVEAIKAYGARVRGEKVTDRKNPLFEFLPKLR